MSSSSFSDQLSDSAAQDGSETMVPTIAMDQRLTADRALVANNQLHRDCQAHFTPADIHVPRAGVVLMLHGFTAGPWQFRPLQARLKQYGLASYAARLPGHGAVSRSEAHQQGPASADPIWVEDGSLLPRSRQATQFAACADQALDDALGLAESYAVPLYLVGFSAGGAMALDLLRRRGAAIQRAVLLAPLMRPKGWGVRLFFSLLRWLPLGGLLSDRWAFGWREGPPRPDGWRRAGHSRFFLGNVYALFSYAAKSRPRRKDRIEVPCQVVVTELDTKVDNTASRAFVEREPGHHHFFSFAAEHGVPHAMLTPEENPNAQSIEKILDIATRFLLRGEGTQTP